MSKPILLLATRENRRPRGDCFLLLLLNVVEDLSYGEVDGHLSIPTLHSSIKSVPKPPLHCGACSLRAGAAGGCWGGLLVLDR